MWILPSFGSTRIEVRLIQGMTLQTHSEGSGAGFWSETFSSIVNRQDSAESLRSDGSRLPVLQTDGSEAARVTACLCHCPHCFLPQHLERISIQYKWYGLSFDRLISLLSVLQHSRSRLVLIKPSAGGVGGRIQYIITEIQPGHFLYFMLPTSRSIQWSTCL